MCSANFLISSSVFLSVLFFTHSIIAGIFSFLRASLAIAFSSSLFSTNITKYINECLKHLVTQAEQKYGDGTGKIKRSEVFRELLKLFPSLEDYIIDGDITTEVIGDLIDEAVDYMNELSCTNDKVAQTFRSNQPEQLESNEVIDMSEEVPE